MNYLEVKDQEAPSGGGPKGSQGEYTGLDQMIEVDVYVFCGKDESYINDTSLKSSLDSFSKKSLLIIREIKFKNNRDYPNLEGEANIAKKYGLRGLYWTWVKIIYKYSSV